MEKATFLEKIDQYLDGIMTPADKVAFESLIESNIDMKNEFESQKKIRTAIELLGRKELIDDLTVYKAEVAESQGKTIQLEPNKNSPFSLRFGYMIGVAASLLVLFMAVFLINRSQGDISPALVYTSLEDITILPEEGKFGLSPISEKVVVEIYKSQQIGYQIHADTLRIYSDQQLNTDKTLRIQKRGNQTIVNGTTYLPLEIIE